MEGEKCGVFSDPCYFHKKRLSLRAVIILISFKEAVLLVFYFTFTILMVLRNSWNVTFAM